MKKKRLTVLALGALLALVLSGCTGSSSDESTYSKIIEKGEMTFAMTGAYPPFNYIDANGDLAGFDIEIAHGIAEKMGVTATPITVEWDGIIGGLTGNRFDMIIGSMAVTDERLKEVSFTDPYYYDGAQFFAKAGSGLNSISELDNGKVGVVTGTTFHEYLQGMDNIAETLQFQSDVDNFKSVDQGRSDGLVTSKVVGARAPIDYGVAIEPVGDLLYTENIAIAIRQDDTELLAAVNTALAEMIADGSYEEISNRWFGMNILEK
ncbi:MAG: transporter substrate-binding domain-containing protein [Firmicutes bacterium]|nr:transporter substrate-binding domain-containing protein [Bacillota bacterium]